MVHTTECYSVFKGNELCLIMERQDHLKCLILGEKPNVKRLPIVWKIPITWLSETRKGKKTEKDQRFQGVFGKLQSFSGQSN